MARRARHRRRRTGRVRAVRVPAVATALVSAILLAIHAAAVPLAAQDCACAAPPLPVRWSAYASVAAATMRTDAINAALAPRNYFAVSDDAIGWGAGWTTSWGALRLGLEHVRLDAGEESTPAGRSARLEASYTMATVGWDLRPRGRLSLAPTFGFGRSELVLTVGDRAGGTVASSPRPTFDEVLAAPGIRSRLAGAQWILEPMVVAEFLVLRRADARRGVTVGTRAGYRIAPNRPDWEYRGRAAAGGPVDQASGPVFRLTLGFGGR